MLLHSSIVSGVSMRKHTLELKSQTIPLITEHSSDMIEKMLPDIITPTSTPSMDCFRFYMSLPANLFLISSLYIFFNMRKQTPHQSNLTSAQVKIEKIEKNKTWEYVENINTSTLRSICMSGFFQVFHSCTWQQVLRKSFVSSAPTYRVGLGKTGVMCRAMTF